MTTLITLTSNPTPPDDVDIDGTLYPAIRPPDLGVDARRQVAKDMKVISEVLTALSANAATTDPDKTAQAGTALDSALAALVPTLDTRSVVLTDRHKIMIIEAVTGQSL